MAYERRLSTESDKSSTSTESTTNYSNLDKNLSIISTKKSTNIVKRNSTTTSPAEIILARTKNTFIDLNPYFQCSSLPNHWRKNKTLHFILRTKNQLEIKTNTRVIILAGNDYNPCATLKNNVSWFRAGQAEFTDLRFLGASGRGKKFTLTIIIETTPPQQCTYRRAIKITVDGPRKKREIKPKSDVNDMQADESNIDADSDNETQTTNTSMITDTKPIITPGSSNLLLLAAVAEQQQKDEKDKPIYRSDGYSLDCLSPPTLLVSRFNQSMGFCSTEDNISSRHVSLPNPLPTANLILSLTSTQNRFDLFHHQQQRRDQQTLVGTSTNSSTSNNSTSAHVLCR